MKFFVCTGFLLLTGLVSIAQLSHTKWKTTILLDAPKNVIFDFGKDTLTVYTIADSVLVETMKYTDKDQVLTMTKISGQSDCDDATSGSYRYAIDHDTIRITMVSDPCTDRSSVVDGSKWFRWKNYKEVQVDAATLQRYVGTYELDPSHQVIVTMENGTLMMEAPNNNLPKLPIMPIGKSKFFLKLAGVEFDFVSDGQGKVIEMISHEDKDYHLKKVK
jgi:uncharacterized protein DUF3471